jgi:SAM-dependent methyltransferase
MQKAKFYNNFHKQTHSQIKVISKNSFTYKPITRILDKYIPKNSKVIDIGCGAGSISAYLASKGNSVLGIDVSSNAINECIATAQKLNLTKNLTYQTMDFPNDVPNQKFDAALLLEVIEHLSDDNKALTYAVRLLKDNGVLIVTVPSLNAPLYKLGAAKEFDARVGHLRRYMLNDLKTELESIGLKVVFTKKHEGILRNSLYLLPYFGILIKLIRGPLVDLFTFLDYLFLKTFGESDIIIVAQKI